MVVLVSPRQLQEHLLITLVAEVEAVVIQQIHLVV
jgi:hypothetical protein